MVTVLRTELYKEGHTGHRQCSRDHSLFRIRFVVIVAPFCKGRDSHWGTHPRACDWEHISSVFRNPAACVASLVPTLCSGGMAHRLSVVRSHISLFGELDLASWNGLTVP